MITAIILAGGLGTRLRSAVPDLPKPMAPVNGRPFLSYLMDYWIAQGVRKFILSVGYKNSVIQDHYGSRYRYAELDYSVEETPLGTGGGLLLALRKLESNEDFLVLNGDTFFTVNLDEVKNHHQQAQADMTMALLDVMDNDRYGSVSMSPDGYIVSLDASASRSDVTSKRVNGGVYWMKLGLFEAYATDASSQRCSLEDDLFPTLLNNGKRIAGCLSSGVFIDIGVPEDYRLAAGLLAEFAR